MNESELKSYFETQYKDTFARRIQEELPQAMREYINGGMPESEAKLAAIADIRSEATFQAVLRTIAMNNARIQSQLEQKGIDV